MSTFSTIVAKWSFERENKTHIDKSWNDTCNALSRPMCNEDAVEEVMGNGHATNKCRIGWSSCDSEIKATVLKPHRRSLERCTFSSWSEGTEHPVNAISSFTRGIPLSLEPAQRVLNRKHEHVTCPLRLAQCCPHGSCLHGLGNANELMMAKWSHGAGACEPANVWQTRTGSAFRIN